MSSVEEMMDRFMQVAEEGEPEGPVGGMVVGGVDLRDLQQAHAEHGPLSRWMLTSIKLIPDFYETQETLLGQIRQLEAVGKAQAKRIKELEERHEPEDPSPSPEPLAGPEEADIAARKEQEAKQKQGG